MSLMVGRAGVLSAGGAPAAPFSPVDLFASGEAGGFWDFTDANILTGTAAAIGSLADLSGNGNTLLDDSTPGAEVELVDDGYLGSRRSAWGGSINSGAALRCTLPAAISTPFTVFFVGFNTSSDIQCFFELGPSGGSPSYRVQNSSGNDLIQVDGTTTIDTGQGANTCPRALYIFEFDGANSKFIRHDRVHSTGTLASISGCDTLYVGRFNPITASRYGANYGLWSFGLIDRILTAQEKADLLAWSSQRMDIPAVPATAPIVDLSSKRDVYSDAGGTTPAGDGDNVLNWGNAGSSGGFAEPVATITQNATLDAGFLNGHDVVRFPGNRSRMTLGVLSAMGLAPGIHGVVLWGATNPLAQNYPMGAYGPTASERNFIFFSGNNTALNARVYTDAGSIDRSVTAPNETFMDISLFSWSASSGVLRVRRYLTDQTDAGALGGTGLVAATEDFTVGGTESDARDITGAVAAVRLFNTEFSVAEEEAILQEIALEFGL